MRGNGWLTALVVLGLAASAAAKETAKPAPKAGVKKGVVWPAGDLKWTDNPAIKGAQQAVLWGDPKVGAYGALKKLPGGTDLPLHTHSHEQKVVVVAGTIAFNFEGEDSKDLGPGSFASIPAGLKHLATCKAGADCVYFEESAGASDFKVAQPAKK